MALTCHMPPSMGRNRAKRIVRPKEHILLVDSEQHVLQREYATLPRWLMRTKRTQALTMVIDEQVTRQQAETTYTTVEVFSGPFTFVVKWTITPMVVQSCSETMGMGLKEGASLNTMSDQDRSLVWHWKFCRA